MNKDTVFLVGFFKFDEKGPEYGFKRMDLWGIFKSEKEAREDMSFCDEAGWYEGALIEERAFGVQFGQGIKHRIWLIQQPGGEMKEITEPDGYKNCICLI
jgi:hypothetical protein